MKLTRILFAVVIAIAVSFNASGKGNKNEELITAFYEEALTVNTERSPANVLDEILANDYISNGSEQTKTKEQLIGQLQFFWKLIPDLKWDIQEIVNVENRYIVRSRVTGSPKGDFMGQATDGTKQFTIMTIDIHTIKDGKIQQTFHVEDWATAIRQLSTESPKEDQAKTTMDVAMGFMEAMGKGDMEKMVALMHDDMVWQNEGDKSMPWIGPWKGKQTILEDFFPVFMENFKTVKWEPNDALSSGNTAVFFGHMVGMLTQSNQETREFTYALRVKVKDGKVILWNWFEDSYEVSRAFHGNK